MTNRELLELAAKAAGFLNWTWRGESLFVETGHSRANTGYYWNPLTDDGDALRLAVKLKFPISYGLKADLKTKVVHVSKYWDSMDSMFYPFEENLSDCPYAATRRAIVRAAAEIGKGIIPFPSADEIERFGNMDNLPEFMK